jgi:hypothetical protein
MRRPASWSGSAFGQITVLNRAKLEQLYCECYELLKKEIDDCYHPRYSR